MERMNKNMKVMYNPQFIFQKLPLEAQIFHFDGNDDYLKVQIALEKEENRKGWLNAIERTKQDVENFISVLNKSNNIMNSNLLQYIYNQEFMRLAQFPSIDTLLLCFNCSQEKFNANYIKLVIEREYELSLNIIRQQYPVLFEQYKNILFPKIYEILRPTEISGISIDNTQLTRDIFGGIQEHDNLTFQSTLKMRKLILNIDGKIFLKKNIQRTKDELMLDLYVYNAINSLYYNNKTQYVTLKQIKNLLYGDDSRVSKKQEQIIKSSIDFLNNISLEISFNNINKYIDVIFNTRKENLKNFIKGYLGDNYVYKGLLLDVSYTQYRTNNGKTSVAIKIESPVVPYAFALALKQIIHVPSCILKEVNEDYERIDELIMLSSIYLCSFTKTKKIGYSAVNKKRILRLDTLFEKLNLTDVSNQNIRNVRSKLYKHIGYVFEKLKENKIIKSFAYEKQHRKIYFES